MAAKRRKRTGRPSRCGLQCGSVSPFLLLLLYQPTVRLGFRALRSETMQWEKVRAGRSDERTEDRPTFSRSCNNVRPFLVISATKLMVRGFRPQGTQVVSPGDREIMEENGLAVVECSWVRLEEIPWGKIKSPHERVREYGDYPAKR